MRLRKFSVIIISLILILSLVACPANPPGGDDDGSLEMVTLSGTFAGVMDEGFLLIATDTVTGFTYATAVGADGSFSIDVPKDNSCMYAVVDEAGRARGVMVFADNTRSISRDVPTTTDVTTGMKLSEDHTIFAAITLPSNIDPGKIDVDIDPDLLDDSVTARVSDGELLGFGTGSDFGKGSFTFPTAIGDGGKADPDGDGLPSVIDADDDGDGIPDDWDKFADGDDDALSVDPSPVVNFSLGFLLDIRENSGVYSYDTDNPAYTSESLEDALRRDMRIDFQVRFQDAADFASVESVRLFLPSSPAYAAALDAVEFKQEGGGFATYTFANGDTFTPTNASIAWSNFVETTSGDGYNIPENLNDPNTFTISVKIPQSSADLFEVGDIFTIEIQYSGGGVEYLSQMINYTYTNGTHFDGYTLTVGDTPVDDHAVYTLFNFGDNTPNQIVFANNTDDTVQFTFVPPKDEHGDYILPDETDGSADSGFRIELFPNPNLLPAGSESARNWNLEHKRFDSMLSDLTRIDDAGEVYFVGIVPLDYLKALVDLEADPVLDTFDMEYFLNFTTDSFIKNRLTFRLVDNTVPD